MKLIKPRTVILPPVFVIIAICIALSAGCIAPFGGETTKKYRSNLALEDMADEVVAALWENPRGCFILDDYLYYGYGKERYDVRTFTGGGLTGHYNFVFLDYKDFHFARLNLSTLENEEIARQVYEDTVDYMEFIDWRNVSEPITRLVVFVWLDRDREAETFFRLRNGVNTIYKKDWYEYLIYHVEPSSNHRYVPPAPVTNKIEELNRMLSKYPDVLEITIYQMHADDFTEAEMAEIVSKIIVPNNCVKTIALW